MGKSFFPLYVRSMSAIHDLFWRGYWTRSLEAAIVGVTRAAEHTAHQQRTTTMYVRRILLPRVISSLGRAPDLSLPAAAVALAAGPAPRLLLPARASALAAGRSRVSLL